MSLRDPTTHFFRQGWEQVKLRMEQLQVAKQKLQDWLKSTGRWG